MNSLDMLIADLVNELIAMKGLDYQEAHASVQALLRTDICPSTVISFLKFALEVA
jgi:hypothetical protein